MNQEKKKIGIKYSFGIKKGQIIVPPKCITKAFSANDASISKRIEEITFRALEILMERKTTFANIKSTIKHEVETYVYRKTERKPLIIPVVMDSNE